LMVPSSVMIFQTIYILMTPNSYFWSKPLPYTPDLHTQLLSQHLLCMSNTSNSTHPNLNTWSPYQTVLLNSLPHLI
jgi:hypothetical protein